MKKMWAGLWIALSMMAIIQAEGWAQEHGNLLINVEAASVELESEQAKEQITDATESKFVTYRLEGEEAIVTGAVDPDRKRIVIPSVTKIEGRYYPVTAIEKEAFKGMKELRTVIVGSDVKSVGEGAFDECPNLEHLVFKGEDPRKDVP